MSTQTNQAVGIVLQACRGHKSGTCKVYKGLHFSPDTDDKVVKIVGDNCDPVRVTRLRIFYGDVVTGRDWGEEEYTIGYVGRSTGECKIPLLIPNSRSRDGNAILTNSIVKIVDTGSRRVLYEHPNYTAGKYTVRPVGREETIGNANLYEEGYRWAVDRDGENVANFKKEGQAEAYRQFMLGLRHAK